MYDYKLREGAIPKDHPRIRSDRKLMVVDRSSGTVQHRKFVEVMDYYQDQIVYVNRAQFFGENSDRNQPLWATGLATRAPHGAGIPFENWMVDRMDLRFVELLCGYQNTMDQIKVHDNRQTNREFYQLCDCPTEPVHCIGGTTVKALESYAQTGSMSGPSSWYGGPGVQLRLTKSLLTCFHLPGQPLMALVSLMLGEDHLQESYRIAMAEGYKVTEKGDRMLIL